MVLGWSPVAVTLQLGFYEYYVNILIDITINTIANVSFSLQYCDINLNIALKTTLGMWEGAWKVFQKSYWVIEILIGIQECSGYFIFCWDLKLFVKMKKRKLVFTLSQKPFTINIYIYMYIYIYGIHHWRIFRSSYRKFAWVKFEPTTTEFRSDALNIYIYVYI